MSQKLLNVVLAFASIQGFVYALPTLRTKLPENIAPQLARTAITRAAFACGQQLQPIVDNTAIIQTLVESLLECPCSNPNAAGFCFANPNLDSQLDNIATINDQIRIGVCSILEIINNSQNCTLNETIQEDIVEIETKTVTVLDQVNGLLESCNTTTVLGCSPQPIMPLGTVTLSNSGNYCLVADTTADIIILADDITLDLNGRCLNGTVVLLSSARLNLKNGYIQPTSNPTENAGLTIDNCRDVIVSDVVIDCTAITKATQFNAVLINYSSTNIKLLHSAFISGNGINGLRGGNGINGNSVQGLIVEDCIITAGNGGDSNASTGGSGGTGIFLDSASTNNLIVENCIINSGFGGGGNPGGDGGNGVSIAGTVIPVIKNCSITAGSCVDGAQGGKGGNGIAFGLQGTTFILENCLVTAGNGGNATTTTGNGGNGGVGIDISTSIGLIDPLINHCLIKGGNGGTSISNTDGNGGIGINYNGALSNVATNQVIKSCEIIGGNGAGSMATVPGQGGDAITLAYLTNPLIEQCKITSGNGNGNGIDSFGGSLGGVCVNFLTTVNYCVIDNCEIIHGTSHGTIGSDPSTILLNSDINLTNNKIQYCTITNTTYGNVITIKSGPQFTEVMHCILSEAVLAVDDMDSSSNSIIFNNFAYHINPPMGTLPYVIRNNLAPLNVINATDMTSPVPVFAINANYYSTP